MPRTKGASSRKKKKKLFARAKGRFLGRRRLLRAARETERRALAFATRHRRTKKREFRRLWIARVNAAVRAEGMTYSRFLEGLRRSGIEINRKSLSELAIQEPSVFRHLVEKSRAAATA
jgi:large subunit ribosomal protein L20